ncbi:MAG: hypothetical protein QOF80_674, partial [Verrucomicrobiota bacterium]
NSDANVQSSRRSAALSGLCLFRETIYPEFRYASLRALVLRASGAGQHSAIRLPFSSKEAIVRGANNSSGIAVVEMYVLN